ncbi:phage protein [Geomicrobium sp. JCM 19055]|nr:phage protein [Geomicrobium sp. JCM 19055]
MYYTVKLVGTQVIDQFVNEVESRGNPTGVRLEYGHNLTSVTRTEDSTRVVTALIGVGQGGSDGERMTLNGFSDFDNGTYYREETTDWIGSREALERWSTDGNHIFDIHFDDQAETQTQLFTNTYAELRKRVTPKLTYEVGLVDLEKITGYSQKKVRLGDEIVVVDKTFNPYILLSARVLEVHRSYNDSNNDNIVLGEFDELTFYASSQVRRLQLMISRYAGKWETGGGISKEEVEEMVEHLEEMSQEALEEALRSGEISLEALQEAIESGEMSRDAMEDALEAIHASNVAQEMAEDARKEAEDAGRLAVDLDTKVTYLDGEKVSFNDLAVSGRTEINGGNIVTGSLSANRIQGGVISGVDIDVSNNVRLVTNYLLVLRTPSLISILTLLTVLLFEVQGTF